MKIIFTSCIRYEAFNSQPHWGMIKDQDPDYLFLLGDTIYMDFGIKPFSKEPVGSPKGYSPERFEQVMNQKYQNQFKLVPEFKGLVEYMKSKNGFYATWDDHDFAWNDAKGALMDEKKKDISAKLFHKYLNCSTNYPHIYYTIDTPLARVIFIDNRTAAERPGPTSQLISEEQFDFIEHKLNHGLRYTLICGGLSLTESSENWSKYSSQMKRMCKLLADKKNVFFLAGDIHKNKFIKPRRVVGTDCLTPVQLISSGMQINYFGLGWPFDDQHNWALLELEEDEFKISFYNKRGLEKRKSERATEWIVKNYWAGENKSS